MRVGAPGGRGIIGGERVLTALLAEMQYSQCYNYGMVGATCDRTYYVLASSETVKKIVSTLIMIVADALLVSPVIYMAIKAKNRSLLPMCQIYHCYTVCGEKR